MITSLASRPATHPICNRLGTGGEYLSLEWEATGPKEGVGKRREVLGQGKLLPFPTAQCSPHTQQSHPHPLLPF